MELNINSPAYFSRQYGVDDEVYRYCQNLHEFFKDKEYSETLSIIGIIPIIAPKELYEQGMWKERTQLVSLGSCAIIHIRMDFKSYYHADSSGRIALVKEMLVRAVKKIKTRGKFDWESFCEDLSDFTCRGNLCGNGTDVGEK